MVWPATGDSGERTFKFFCPSIDHARHKTVEAANAVKSIAERFLGDNVDVFFIMGDSVGGGAVQPLHKKLKDMSVMPEESRMANCSLHGMQKAIQNASINNG